MDIEKHGFCYKDKRYTHDDIKRVDISGGNGRALRVSVKLKDGELILVNVSALELNGKKARTGFLHAMKRLMHLENILMKRTLNKQVKAFAVLTGTHNKLRSNYLKRLYSNNQGDTNE